MAQETDSKTPDATEDTSGNTTDEPTPRPSTGKKRPSTEIAAGRPSSSSLHPPNTGQRASGKDEDDSDDDNSSQFKSTRNSVSVVPAQSAESQTMSPPDIDGTSDLSEDTSQTIRPDSTLHSVIQANGHASEPLQETAPEPIDESNSSRPTSSHALPAAVEEPPSPPKKRLMKSPFSFFSRNTSGTDKTLKSVSSQPTKRRGTVSSTTTTDSQGTQSKAENEAASDPKRPDRNSLKDRFKLLRMQEEAGIKWTDDADGERPDSSSSKVDVSAMLPAQDDENTPGTRGRAVSTPMSPLSAAKPPTLNESLPPGTAAGTTAGPSPEQAKDVDWDLWQAVVYEGPAAVARTSEGELREAIANGIPSAIRGVVWQVLAQSQSAELEALYGELVRRKGESKSRTTSELKPRPRSIQKRESSSNVDGSVRESITSSGSSMHSAMSSPASPAGEMVGSPATSQDANSIEAHAKAHALLEVEEKKRAKEAATALTKLERSIKRDLGARTSYSKFLASAGLQSGLFGICKAYALYDKEVGYAQGMNFIAMPLLFNMPEEEAFCLFVRLMNQYHLRDMFIPEMPGLHLHLYQFERLLEDFEPALFCHLHRRGVNPQLYATQWFLTLFAYRFPLQLVLRIYDLILSEGLESAILKFGITLMQKNAPALLEMKDMAVLTTYLKERLFDVYIDKSPSASSVLESGFFGSAGGIDKEVYRADALVQDACAISITPELLKQYTSEWETSVREAKQKAAEEDSLRSANSALSLQVRNLEERSEKYDAEHVQIASELVRTKVSNQELADANESLTTRVTELQEIITKQPGETEDRLRAEMERIIGRNSEVQGQNRHLEEALEEMEQELVKSKVDRANMAEELEALKSKWHSVNALMSGKGSPRLT